MNGRTIILVAFTWTLEFILYNFSCMSTLDKLHTSPPHLLHLMLPIAPHMIDLPLKLDNGQVSMSLEIQDQLCHFCSYAVIEDDVYFMLECPLCNPIRDKFPSLFENVVARSLKSFLQIEQQVNISFYLTEANTLCHSRKSLGLKPS